MELSVPANYDIKIVSQLARYPVKDVYGKLPHDLAGGGRASFSSTPLNFNHLKNYIAELNKYNIDFTYLLNSSCLANREWSRRWQKKLFRFLEKLQEAKVKRLTVSTPLLFKIIKKSFPDFYMKVGIFAQVDTPSRAIYWQKLGADEITLESFSINRDFKKLSKIRNAVNCALQLIVNHPCLPNCPMQYYHQNCLSHASDGSRQIFIDYCFLTCTYERLKDPSLFIKSQWIRPEDLTVYENLGFDKFKLLERNIPSTDLLKRVQAYSLRKSPANLADLILPYGFEEKDRNKPAWLMKNFFKPLQIRPWKLKPFLELIKSQGILQPLKKRNVQIDSALIPDDFLEQIQSVDCSVTDCSTCRCCSEIARNAITIDDDFKRRAIERYENIDHLITTGKVWNVQNHD